MTFFNEQERIFVYAIAMNGYRDDSCIHSNVPINDVCREHDDMPQKRIIQEGLFHVTTVTRNRIPWCTMPGIPPLLIDNLLMTRNQHSAILAAFSILPDHMHILVCPGEKGLSAFMHSFKRNSSFEIRTVAGVREPRLRDRNNDMYCSGWQAGFHDELIRDDRQRSAAYGYVVHNAWRHGLVDDPDAWPWSSVHFPDLINWSG